MGLLHPASPLVGREREIATLHRLLQRSDVALVTLTGPGGIGKTRLALEIGNELRDRYEDGVVRVSLAAIRDPELVVPAIAAVLGAVEFDHRASLKGLKVHLRDRRMLLLIDNFEQVAAAAPVVAELLAGAPRLQIVVTSRVRLRLSAEHELRIGALPLPRPDATELDVVAAAPAVALFLQCARAAEPAFRLSAHNVAAVRGICTRIDGWPLAIELAAARVRLLPPDALLERLARRLPVLTGGAMDRPARQRTVRGALDWSCELLGAEARDLFAQLAVFDGGCTLDAIEAVCGLEAEPLFEQVGALVDHGLLLREGTRLGMLETIREYALECLARDRAVEATARRRHAGHFVVLAESAEAELRGPRQKAWLDRIEAEHANMRAALGWSLTHREPLLALRLGAALGPFWGARGHFSEGRRWLASAIAAGGAAPAVARARAFGIAGDLAWKQGDFPVAASMHGSALDLYRSLGDTAGIAETLNDLGNLALGRHEYEAAIRWHRESLELMRATGDRWGEARASMGCANVHFQQGDDTAAQAEWEASLAIFRSLADDRAIANVVVNLGALAARRGASDTARLLYAEGLEIARALGLAQLLASTAYNIGDLALQLGDLRAAGSSFQEALTTAFRSGEKVTIAYALEGLAAVCARASQPHRAAQLFGAADALREAIGSPRSPAELDDHRRHVAAMHAQAEPGFLDGHMRQGQAQPLAQTVADALAFDLSSAGGGAVKVPDSAGLTPREIEVVRLVAQGLSDARVARQLKISPATVSKHVANALGKTMLRNRVELTLWSLERGLVDAAGAKPAR